MIDLANLNFWFVGLKKEEKCERNLFVILDLLLQYYFLFKKEENDR